MSLISIKDLVPVVIDNGSAVIKAGFARQDIPQVFIPAVTGLLRHNETSIRTSSKKQYVGNETDSCKELLSIRYPIEHGIVTNWDDMEQLWSHTFYNELHTSPENHPILITEAPLNPKANREKMSQLLFEHFNTPAMYVSIQAVLSFYTLGRATGIVLESGDGVSQIVPIFQGYPIVDAIERLDLAGRDVTNYLMELLRERGYSFSTSYEHEIVRDMKEKLAYVSQNFHDDLSISLNNSKRFENSYELPDGQKLKMGNELFRCSEALFTPTTIGQKDLGIAHLLNKAIMKCDIDMRDRFYSKILLSGGTTLIPGLESRLEKEMINLTSPNQTIHITSDPQRKVAVWIGGSMLCSLSSFDTMWITRHEYDEFGPSIVHRKCL